MPYYTRARHDLTATIDSPYNQQGDERISHLGRGDYNKDEFEDMVDLWEVYLPRERLIYTFTDDYQGTEAPLRVQKWIGPDRGPYHFLSYGLVPGNAMPKGPIQDLMDLHLLANNLYRKLSRQAERQKTNLVVSNAAADDGKRHVDAMDGEVIVSDRPSEVIIKEWGGPFQANFMFFLDVIQRFSYMAGNLDMMGGLSPQSKTLGQDKMLNESASGGITDQQERTVEFVADAIESLCWFWHNDPFKVMQSQHSLPGLSEVAVTRNVTPGQRGKIPFEQLKVETDPYSLVRATPESRASKLNQLVQTIVLPMQALLQQQGIQFDLNAYLKLIGTYWDMPDLVDLLTVQEPPDAQSTGSSADDPGGMPAQTERTYNRVSMPGRTDAGNNRNMMSALAGVNPGGAANGSTNGTMNGAAK